jgi:GH24 family phage-related lysozyme (muramidase)
VITDLAKCAEVVRLFEGFTPRAKWDMNAYRLGYGSDTRGALQYRVKRGDTTTRAEAEANLDVRLKQFEDVAARQVGRPLWETLPQSARSALVSLAYNYGRLPLGVADALRQRLPLPEVARRVAALGHANGGINKDRREKEAALIRGGPFGG